MKTYFRILGYGRAARVRGIVGFASVSLYNVMSAISMALVIPFLDILFAQPDPALATTAIDWSNSGLKEGLFTFVKKWIVVEGKHSALVWFCLILGSAILLKSLFRYIGSYNFAYLEQGVIEALRNRLFQHLTRLPLGYYTHKRKGHIVNTVVNDVQIVQEAVIGTVMNVFSDPITVLVFLTMMILISWKLTLFTLVVLPVTGLFISRISKTLKRKAHRGQSKLDEVMAVFDEFLTGIRVVKAFRAERFETERYERVNREYTDIMTRFRQREGLASPVTEVLSIFVVLTIIYYGASLIISETSEISAQEFIGFIAMFSQILAPMKTFSSAITRIQKALVSFARIEELLKIPVAATEFSKGKPLNGFSRNIEVRNLSFGYADRPVLQNISFTINKGQTVALVGPSGAGKSTLVDLICRFYDPQSGAILVDGQDMRELEPGSIRNLMGIVTQEPILFNDTIARNIAYGQAETPTEAELEEAARVANALDFIRDFPEGFQTVVGERGGRLSGGQRQRIAIARAVFRNPPILVLDEATSSLDAESEGLVQQALQSLMQNRTSIIIAHRLSTVTHADLILVFNQQGMIVERGTHSELIANGGFYKLLVEKQLQLG